jgi:hypothetical protein
MNDKQIKAECCGFGREYLRWGGAQWWVLFNLQRGGGSWPATHCICGTKLTPPPEPVYVTELERRALDIALDKEYHDCGDLTPTYKGLRSLLARSRIKETE